MLLPGGSLSESAADILLTVHGENMLSYLHQTFTHVQRHMHLAPQIELGICLTTMYLRSQMHLESAVALGIL